MDSFLSHWSSEWATIDRPMVETRSLEQWTYDWHSLCSEMSFAPKSPGAVERNLNFLRIPNCPTTFVVQLGGEAAIPLLLRKRWSILGLRKLPRLRCQNSASTWWP